MLGREGPRPKSALIQAAHAFLAMFKPSECRVVVLVDTHCAIDTGEMIYRVDDRGALSTPIARVRVPLNKGFLIFLIKQHPLLGSF